MSYLSISIYMRFDILISNEGINPSYIFSYQYIWGLILWVINTIISVQINIIVWYYKSTDLFRHSIYLSISIYMGFDISISNEEIYPSYIFSYQYILGLILWVTNTIISVQINIIVYTRLYTLRSLIYVIFFVHMNTHRGFLWAVHTF